MLCYVLVNMINTMTSMMLKVLDNDGGKEEQFKKLGIRFQWTRNITRSISVAKPSNLFGLHPEQIKDNDYVSKFLKEKIVNGKGVVLLLMKSFKKVHDGQQMDARRCVPAYTTGSPMSLWLR